MQTNFKIGVPSMKTIVRTPFGLGTFAGFAGEEHVYLYVGGGRTFRVPNATPWDPA